MTASRLARESIKSARSQPVVSIATMIIIAAMCITVLLTTGRTVGAEQRVLSTIDSAGTRSIVVRSESGSGLTESVLGRLSRITGIEWSGAFGPALDARNANIPGGTNVPVRVAYASSYSNLGLPRSLSQQEDSAYASSAARSQLGLEQPSGGLIGQNGRPYTVRGPIEVPDYLSFLEPLVVVPAGSALTKASAAEPVSVLVVIAERPDRVAAVADSVRSLLGVTDRSKVTITTSAALAALRASVQSQLGLFGHTLVLGVFSISAVLVGSILFAFVMLRRRDFGRRRALGATRGLIVQLLLMQVGALSVVGALIGEVVAVVILSLSRDPIPAWDYLLAIATLAVVTGLVAAAPPAVAASRRDPLRELRVP